MSDFMSGRDLVHTVKKKPKWFGFNSKLDRKVRPNWLIQEKME